MIDEEFEKFIESQRINELTRDFAELNEIIGDKDIYIITCNIAYQEKRLYTNLLVIAENKLIIKRVPDFRLFLKELKHFYINDERKFVELKSRKTERGIEQSLKIKNTSIYLNKAEADLIVNVAENIERAYKFANQHDMKICEDTEYLSNLLKKSKIIED